MGADDLDDDFHLIASPPRRKRTHQEQSDDEDPSIFDIAPDASDELPSNAEDSVQREIQPARKKKKTKTKDHSTKWSEQRLKLRSEILQESGVHESQVPDSDFTLDADRSLPSLLKLVTSMRKSDDRQILIICPSAERAITIGPALKSIGKIGKLFARHMKVEEQLKSLRSHSFPICVGTPNRILKLLEAAALSPEKLSFVIMDGTAQDKKERTLFDIPELKSDLIAVLKLLQKNKVLVF